MKDCDGRKINLEDVVRVVAMSTYIQESNVRIGDLGTVVRVPNGEGYGLADVINPSWRNTSIGGNRVPFTSGEIELENRARKATKRLEPSIVLHICPIALYGKCRNGKCPHRVEHEQIHSYYGTEGPDKYLCQNIKDHDDVDCAFRHTALFHCVPIVGPMAASGKHESAPRPNNGIRRITLKKE